jgi:hypothetical protein
MRVVEYLPQYPSGSMKGRDEELLECGCRCFVYDEIIEGGF